MSLLLSHQAKFQVLAELIRSSLGIEVFFVDKQRFAVAGTGPYRCNVGTTRPTDSYVDLTIKEGADQLVTEPRYTKQCYRCEYRSLCPYSMVMCRPMIRDGRIQGLMGYLAFSEDQRRVMAERSSFLQELPGRLDYIWELTNEGLEYFLAHPGTRRFINRFDDGLVLTTRDFRLLNMNQKAEHLVKTRGIAFKDGQAPVLDRGRQRGTSNKAQTPRSIADPVMGGRSGAYPISDGRGDSGNLVVFADCVKPAGHFKSCHTSTNVPCNIVGVSPSIMSLKERAYYAAQSDSTVLLLGETGSGKEVVARYIHAMSPRATRPFEAVNCAAIPDSLFESELFGYAPGAFTGARKNGKPGKFHLAQGGTIFLDEVGRLSLQNQAKILRILEEGEVERLGDDLKRKVDVRVLAATNIDLGQAMEEGRFLKDLYYRLAVLPLRISPLKERAEDIPLLITHFVSQLLRVLPSSDFRGFSDEAMNYLLEYPWPGNVRQLRNSVEYAMNIVRGREVTVADLQPVIPVEVGPRSSCSSSPPGETSSLKSMEADHITRALETFGRTTEGKRRAALHLGISLSTLYRKIAKMDAAR